MFVLAAVVIASCHTAPQPPRFVNSGTPHGVPIAADCIVRELAWVYGLSIGTFDPTF